MMKPKTKILNAGRQKEFVKRSDIFCRAIRCNSEEIIFELGGEMGGYVTF